MQTWPHTHTHPHCGLVHLFCSSRVTAIKIPPSFQVCRYLWDSKTNFPGESNPMMWADYIFHWRNELRFSFVSCIQVQWGGRAESGSGWQNTQAHIRDLQRCAAVSSAARTSRGSFLCPCLQRDFWTRVCVCVVPVLWACGENGQFACSHSEVWVYTHRRILRSFPDTNTNCVL